MELYFRCHKIARCNMAKKEDVLFKLAKTEVNKFARNVLEDCFDLANDYDYEKRMGY